MTPIEPDELREWERLAEAATPGEWWSIGSMPTPGVEQDFNVVVGDQEDRVCECHEGECRPQENAEFIAAAREIVPRLIAAYREATERIKQLEQSNRDLAGSIWEKHW